MLFKPQGMVSLKFCRRTVLPANGLTLRDCLWSIVARLAGYVLNSLTALNQGGLGSHQVGVLDKHLAFTSDFINPDSPFLDCGKVLSSQSKCYCYEESFPSERKEERGCGTWGPSWPFPGAASPRRVPGSG